MPFVNVGDIEVYYELPAGPGFGYELDEGKIKRRAELP